MTLSWPWPILRQGQIGSAVRLNGKKSFNREKLAAKDYTDWIILLMKRIWPQGGGGGCLPLYQGYIHVYNYYYQNLLLWNRLANQSQILCGATLGSRKES